MAVSMSYRPAYRFSYPKGLRKTLIGITTAGILSASVMGAVAFDGAYEPGAKIEGDYTFEWGTYAVASGDEVYQYAHGDAGDAYYNTYDGEAWSGWEGYEEQPAPVAYDPAPVAYGDKSYVYYTGDDGYLYQQSWDTYNEPVWEDVSGDYTYTAAPYATVYEDAIYLYGNASDGYVYHKSYTEEAGWGTWEAVNDAEHPAKAEAKPYSVSWDDHDNVFWTGEDGKAYWNRYSYADETWTGAKEIPGDYTYDVAPYAVGYDGSLHTWATTADGVPAYNVFDGEGWAGWEPYEVEWTAAYQPNAYVYEAAVHVVYTAVDGNAYYTQYGADGWYGEWEDLSDNYAYDAQQYSYDDGLYLTYTGEDGSVYYRTYSFDGGGTTDPEPTEEPEY